MNYEKVVKHRETIKNVRQIPIDQVESITDIINLLESKSSLFSVTVLQAGFIKNVCGFMPC